MMSYKQWCVDAGQLAEVIPQSTLARSTVDGLLTNVAPYGVETSPEQVDYDLLDSADQEKFFPVVSKELIQANEPYMLSLFAGQLSMAYVIPGENRSALVIPSYEGSRPIANGLLIVHELQHLTQDWDETFQFRRAVSQSYSPAREPDIRAAQRIVGRSEREAYGLNLDILRAIDGEDFDDYLARWGVDTHIFGQLGEEQGACHFLEKRFSLEPSVNLPWFAWEPISIGNKVRNKLASLPLFSKSIPKPNKGTFIYELWQEGGQSRRLLKSIGRMGVLEQELAGKIPDDHLNETAETIFGSRNATAK